MLIYSFSTLKIGTRFRHCEGRRPAAIKDNVELRSRIERVYSGSAENFDDVLQGVSVCVTEALYILAGKDVILEGAHTQSGALGTRIEALGNILDLAVPLVHQRVQDFHDKKRRGRISHTFVEQRTSLHQSGGNFEAMAQGDALLYAPTIEALVADIVSVKGTAAALDVHEIHRHEEDISSKPGIKKTTIRMQSVSQNSKSAQLKVQDFSITGGAGVVFCNTNSSARHNEVRSGGDVSFLQGENSYEAITQKKRSDAFWQKQQWETERQTTYSACHFSGPIEIEAAGKVLIERVKGREPLDFVPRMTLKERSHDLTPAALHDLLTEGMDTGP